MRSVDEIKASMVGPEDCEDEIALASDLNMSPERVCFIAAALEDDLENNDKRKLFEACVGKTEEEIVKLAYDATVSEDVK